MAGVMVIVLVAVAASTALALVVPTQTVGAGTAVADAGAGPIGGTKLGAPSAPAPHQLQVLQLLRVTVSPGAVVPEVKLAVAGYGAATKQQVQSMVQVLLGLEAPPRPADRADALALAVCHLTGSGLRDALAEAGA